MSGSISRRLVTEGLIYYLDAANPESFISGNTQWNSMDVNKNFVTLVNGPQYIDDFKGVIRFDGTDDALSQSKLFSPSIRNGDVSGETTNNDFELTFEVIFRLLETITAGTTTNFIKTTATNSGLQPVLLSKNADDDDNRLISLVEYKNTTGGTTTIFTTPEPNYIYDVNKWYHLTMSMRKTSATTGEWLLVRNGIVLVQQTLNDIDFWGNSSDILNDAGNRMQASPSGSAAPFFEHDMAIMRVYRKGLTVEECLQNYNALKRRFKLE
jgi:hypothetical protein